MAALQQLAGDTQWEGMALKGTVIPMTLKEARIFVDQHHRHHRSPIGGLFAIGLSANDEVVGVAITGRPVNRNLDNGWTAEVLRVCLLEEVPNGCSQLYGASWRAARALGYRRLVIYTLQEEKGTSLLASGWKIVAKTRGGSWDTPSRPRVNTHPLQGKLRWEVNV